jgi:CheY-like chemotaxis protein
MASTVQSARAALTEYLDGALVDLRLPDGSGFNVIEAARSQRRDVPVLVLTGVGDSTSINRAQRMGVEYACKPVDAENVHCFLSRCSRSKQPETNEVVAEAAIRDYFPATKHGSIGEARESTLHPTQFEDVEHNGASNVMKSSGMLATFVAAYEKSKTVDVLAFYDMARAAASMEREGLLAMAAACTGLCARTLRSYALVGKFIRPEELREFYAFLDDAGYALTRKCLIQLAGLPRSKRSRMLQSLAPSGLRALKEYAIGGVK